MRPLLLSMTQFATGRMLGIIIACKHCIDIIPSTTIHPMYCIFLQASHQVQVSSRQQSSMSC